MKTMKNKLLGKIAFCSCMLSFLTRSEGADEGKSATNAPQKLEKTRLAMEKWIETQQVLSKERKDWQEAKGILGGRLDLAKKEIASLEEKINQAKGSSGEANKKKDDIVDQNAKLKSTSDNLTSDVIRLETSLRAVFKQLPEPLKAKLQPLYQPIPEDPASTKLSVAERYKNVLGILSEVNKANNEITVAYEVHNLANGKPAEVKTIYVGLAQAYFLSAQGEVGIGRPTADGWQWETAAAAAREIATALEILDGKEKPAFVPLPVRIQ